MTDSDDRLLVDLDADECYRLATTQPVGRLAWVSADGPTVVPVNFRLTSEHVQIRTAAYSAMARECDDSLVAFEVDAYDADSRTGWSVLMRGRATLGILRPGAPHTEAWPAGAKAAQLTVQVEQVTGRRLRVR